MQTINPERAWAEGLTQEEFVVAYQRRYGNPDTIPYGAEWIYKEDSKYRGVDPVKPEDLLVDDKMVNLTAEKDKRVAEKKEKEEKGECKCPNCGKVCKSMFGLQAHVRHCKLKE